MTYDTLKEAKAIQNEIKNWEHNRWVFSLYTRWGWLKFRGPKLMKFALNNYEAEVDGDFCRAMVSYCDARIQHLKERLEKL